MEASTPGETVTSAFALALTGIGWLLELRPKFERSEDMMLRAWDESCTPKDDIDVMETPASAVALADTGRGCEDGEILILGLTATGFL